MSEYDRVFVDIDTQRDFIEPSGALYVPGAKDIVENLQRLMHYAADNGIPVISSADAHRLDDPEFAQFGPHCVVGTAGQQKLACTLLQWHCIIESDQQIDDIEALLERYGQLIFNTQTLDVFSNPHAARLIAKLEARQFVVFGVATDYCVAKAVEGLLAAGKPTSLVTDAIAAIDSSRGQELLDQFAAKAVKMLRTEEVVLL